MMGNHVFRLARMAKISAVTKPSYLGYGIDYKVGSTLNDVFWYSWPRFGTKGHFLSGITENYYFKD